MSSEVWQRRLERLWYRDTAPPLLRPLSRLFAGLQALRRHAYRAGWLQRESIAAPVVVVGNLVVGGSGKTPVVLALAEHCRAAGWRPGIVSRGHGARDNRRPRLVTPDDDAAQVGDEPLLLARRSGVPVCIGRDRAAAARRLLAQGVDLVLADDGLQHYRLARDVEIVVIDGERRFGNGWLLPAGPLREPLTRLAEADLVLVNGPAGGEAGFELLPVAWQRLGDGRRVEPEAFAGQAALALAGIGNPARFFASLRRLQIRAQPLPLPDHGRIEPRRLERPAGMPLLMTEKDAVKYLGENLQNTWYLIVKTEFNDLAKQALARLFDDLRPAAAGALEQPAT